MPDSNAPRTSIPTVPKSSGGGPYIAAIVVLILLIGAMAWWKLRTPPPAPLPPVIQSVSATAAPPPPLFDMPPPPELDAGVVDSGVADAAVRPKTGGSELCSGKCAGSAPGALQSALSGAGGAARSCYERALRNNPMLQGRMTVAVRVASNGSVCSASIAQDGLGSPEVASCVAGIFRGRSFPAPTGGSCVDVNIPLSFTPRDGKK